jgi:hypothetical protein
MFPFQWGEPTRQQAHAPDLLSAAFLPSADSVSPRRVQVLLAPSLSRHITKSRFARCFRMTSISAAASGLPTASMSVICCRSFCCSATHQFKSCSMQSPVMLSLRRLAAQYNRAGGAAMANLPEQVTRGNARDQATEPRRRRTQFKVLRRCCVNVQTSWSPAPRSNGRCRFSASCHSPSKGTPAHGQGAASMAGVLSETSRKSRAPPPILPTCSGK